MAISLSNVILHTGVFTVYFLSSNSRCQPFGCCPQCHCLMGKHFEGPAFQVLQINFCCCYWALHNDPLLFGIRVMFLFVALCRGGFFALQGRFLQWWAQMIFAVVGPGDALRSNAERSQPRAPALSKAGTDARTGREQSLQRAHSRHCVHTLPVPCYYHVHGCTTALLPPTTCTQRGPRGLISANPRGAPHASRESHNPAWQPGAFYHHHHFSGQ